MQAILGKTSLQRVDYGQTNRQCELKFECLLVVGSIMINFRYLSVVTAKIIMFPLWGTDIWNIRNMNDKGGGGVLVKSNLILMIDK